MARTDTEIVTELRKLIRSWKHAESCPATQRTDQLNPDELVATLDAMGDVDGVGTVRCTCGLDRVSTVLWGSRETPVRAAGRGWQPGKFVVQHHKQGVLSEGATFVLTPDTDPAALCAIVAYAAVTPDEDLAAHLRAWAKRLHVRFPAPPDLLPSWVATLVEHVSSQRMTVQTALFRLAEQIGVANSATFGVRPSTAEKP